MESTGQEENDYATRRVCSLRTWKSRPHGHESGFVGMQVSDRSTIPRSKLLECPPHMAELESLLEKHDNSPKDSITSCLLLFVALDPAAADVLRALAKST